MDNRYYNYNCPPLMNDGRFISNYVRSSTFDQYVKNVNNINTAHEYRHYLQNNGSEIMNNMKAYLRQTNTCSVEGKCLPMSGPTTPMDPKVNPVNEWYKDLLDEETTELDFMMHTNKDDTVVVPNLQPTFHVNTQNNTPAVAVASECTTCSR